VSEDFVTRPKDSNCHTARLATWNGYHNMAEVLCVEDGDDWRELTVGDLIEIFAPSGASQARDSVCISRKSREVAPAEGAGESMYGDDLDRETAIKVLVEALRFYLVYDLSVSSNRARDALQIWEQGGYGR